jgi:SAM-dependent methyltransferase
MTEGNIDRKTVEGFGEEWSAFDQMALGEAELKELFYSYFSIFPFDVLPRDAEGFDLGCGSGRWARLVAPRVGRLHCIDPSSKALAVARQNLVDCNNTDFHLAAADDIPLADASQDFGYSLGVLHHIPDTAAALASCVRKLKPGAPFLLYLYYSLDNRPFAYRALWRASDVIRRGISKAPFPVRLALANAIATSVYWPLARLARRAERRGRKVDGYPLSFYRHSSFYTMRTDALDRFGTRLEHRFSRAEIEAMMLKCGLEEIVFSEHAPFWVSCGRKA